MKHQQGFTLIELLVVSIFVIVVGSWIWNAVKLISCDFESNYKCEIVHGVGVLVPPLAIVTVWFGNDAQANTEEN